MPRNLRGSHAQDDGTELARVTSVEIAKIRTDFDGRVIRRTGADTDCRGNILAGVAPAREHVMLLRLRPHERKHHAERRQEKIDNNDLSTVSISIVSHGGSAHPGRDFIFRHSCSESALRADLTRASQPSHHGLRLKVSC